MQQDLWSAGWQEHLGFYIVGLGWLAGCDVGLEVPFLSGSGGPRAEVEAWRGSGSWLSLLKASGLYFSASPAAVAEVCHLQARVARRT